MLASRKRRSILSRWAVWNRIWVNAELPDGLSRIAVVGFGGSGGEKELRFALGAISFYRDDSGGTNQNAIFLFFGNHQGSFFDAKTLAQPGGNDDRASLTYFRRFDLHRLNIPNV